MQPLSPPVATVPPKPKSRRRWYWIGGFVLLVLAAPFIAAAIAGWWGERQMQALYAEIDAEDPDWRWPDLCASLQPRPGEPNSAEQIAKVRAFLVSKPFNLPTKWDGVENQKILHFRNTHLNPEQAATLRTAFAALDSTTLAEARKLKDMPNGRFAIEAVDNPLRMRFDQVSHARGVIYLLSHDAMLRGQDKDYDGAIESCQALVNTARAIREHPTLIAQMVRNAGRAEAVAATERALGQGEASEESLKKLQELLEAEAADDGLHQAMRGERAFAEQICTSIRDGKASLSEIFGAPSPSFGDRVVDTFPGFLLSGHPDYLRTMHEQVQIAKLKDVERAEAFNRFNEKFRAGRTSLLARLLVPATSRVVGAAQGTQAMLRTAAVAVAAERYRLKHDQWPNGMKDLIHEGFIKAEYADPYDGKPLRWKRTPTGLIIYSISKDKIDDGGKLNRDNTAPTGSDLGIELWDRSLRRLTPPAIEETAK